MASNLTIKPKNSDIRNMEEFLLGCTQHIDDTRCELAKYQTEQSNLRIKIKSLMEANKLLDTKLAQHIKNRNLVPQSEEDDINRNMSHEILINMQKQISDYKSENDELRHLQQIAENTINSLNKEISSLRKELFQANSVFDIKEKYRKVIKILQNGIERHKEQLDNQEEVNKKLKLENEEILTKCKSLRDIIETKDFEIESIKTKYSGVIKLEEKLRVTLQANNDLRTSLDKLKISLVEATERENAALAKVQEALFIAETAVSQKKVADDLLKQSEGRVLSLQEEYSCLASTISHIMEEAAAKVDTDVAKLKNDFKAREKELINYQSQLIDKLEFQKNLNQDLKEKYEAAEKVLKETLSENKDLIKELQITQKQLMDFKDRLDRYKANIEEGVMCSSQNRQEELNHYILTNKEIKEKYKSTIQEMSKKFEEELDRIRTENVQLKAKLKTQKCIDPVC